MQENDGFEMKQGLNPLHHQSSAGGGDADAIARANVSKAQAEAALGRHKNVIDEQSKEILELKKKVQAQALSSGSSRRVKNKDGKGGGKKTKKGFLAGGVRDDGDDEDEVGGGGMVPVSKGPSKKKMDLDEARETRSNSGGGDSMVMASI